MPSTSASELPTEDHPKRILYGRRAGPKLRPAQRRLLSEKLPEIAITLPRPGALDPADCFVSALKSFALEIGFGGGEHLAFQANRQPETGFLGVEPYTNGVASLLGHIETSQLTNIRILQDDARLLLRVLKPGSLEQIFVLFPDPWPKSRHHKRRIVNLETVALMTRAIKPGGELCLASDDPAYIRWMFEAAMREPELTWLAERPGNWRERPVDQPMTRYERKALAAGRPSVFLRFARI
ncbi:MAG: tRNA (guanosine(46)-N7)-methyltransferase TrmB [Pseudomonadota bacterium]